MTDLAREEDKKNDPPLSYKDALKKPKEEKGAASGSASAKPKEEEAQPVGAATDSAEAKEEPEKIVMDVQVPISQKTQIGLLPKITGGATRLGTMIRSPPAWWAETGPLVPSASGTL